MSWVEKNWKPLTVVGGLLGLSWFAGKRFERAEKPTQELRDYEETFVEAQKENEQKEPYYEVMVDIDSLDNLGDGEPFDGLTLELGDSLGGGRYILSLDYGEGGDEPLMTPSEAKEDYRNQIGITTYSYEPDWDEDTGEWVGSENTNIWVGTINFPTGKQGEGGEFYARVFGFKDDESQSDAENVIMKHITDTIELNVRQRDEEDGMFYPIDYFAENFNADDDEVESEKEKIMKSLRGEIRDLQNEKMKLEEYMEYDFTPPAWWEYRTHEQKSIEPFFSSRLNRMRQFHEKELDRINDINAQIEDLISYLGWIDEFYGTREE